ncbi:MAG: hypothetical protein ACJ798_14845 [Phenylobacterium sp.]
MWAFILLAAGLGSAAPAAAAPLEAPAWAIAPEDGACRTDLELTSRSGAVAPVALVSDGDHVILRFAREGAPAEAFLPIRIDQKPYANLVRRTGEEGVQLMSLSDESLAALKRGKTLQIAWLSDEAVGGSLAGAAQGIADLRTCGAQVAAQSRARDAELEMQRARKAGEARAKALADEQLAAARAQTAAAEAQTRKANAQAEALAAQADQARAYAEQQREREAQVERERYAQQYYYRDRSPPPAPDPYYYPRYYSPR